MAEQLKTGFRKQGLEKKFLNDLRRSFLPLFIGLVGRWRRFGSCNRTSTWLLPIRGVLRFVATEHRRTAANRRFRNDVEGCRRSSKRLAYASWASRCFGEVPGASRMLCKISKSEEKKKHSFGGEDGEQCSFGTLFINGLSEVVADFC